jgi:hypothetical protein
MRRETTWNGEFVINYLLEEHAFCRVSVDKKKLKRLVHKFAQGFGMGNEGSARDPFVNGYSLMAPGKTTETIPYLHRHSFVKVLLGYI